MIPENLETKKTGIQKIQENQNPENSENLQKIDSRKYSSQKKLEPRKFIQKIQNPENSEI